MHDTQQNIIDAAIAVFNDDFSAPLEKVAEQAAVTRRTLHRYFSGREELLAYCERDMRHSCNRAMKVAFDSSPEPLVQLEQMLYAGIECGAKYSFLRKIHTHAEHQHSHQQAGCAEYDAMLARYQSVINRLRQDGIMSPRLSDEWVMQLFQGVLITSRNVEAGGAANRPQLKQFAWFSFSKGIGV